MDWGADMSTVSVPRGLLYEILQDGSSPLHIRMQLNRLLGQEAPPERPTESFPEEIPQIALSSLAGPCLSHVAAQLPLAEILATRACSSRCLDWASQRGVEKLSELRKVHNRIRARLWIERVADLTKDTADETVFETQVRSYANDELRRRMEQEMAEAKVDMERQIHTFQVDVDRRMEEQAMRVHAIIEERVQQQVETILAAEMEKVRTMVEERVQERVRTVLQREVVATVREMQSRLTTLAQENDQLRSAFAEHLDHSDLCYRSLIWALSPNATGLFARTLRLVWCCRRRFTKLSAMLLGVPPDRRKERLRIRLEALRRLLDSGDPRSAAQLRLRAPSLEGGQPFPGAAAFAAAAAMADSHVGEANTEAVESRPMPEQGGASEELVPAMVPQTIAMALLAALAPHRGEAFAGPNIRASSSGAEAVPSVPAITQGGATVEEVGEVPEGDSGAQSSNAMPVSASSTTVEESVDGAPAQPQLSAEIPQPVEEVPVQGGDHVAEEQGEHEEAPCGSGDAEFQDAEDPGEQVVQVCTDAPTAVSTTEEAHDDDEFHDVLVVPEEQAEDVDSLPAATASPDELAREAEIEASEQAEPAEAGSAEPAEASCEAPEEAAEASQSQETGGTTEDRKSDDDDKPSGARGFGRTYLVEPDSSEDEECAEEAQSSGLDQLAEPEQLAESELEKQDVEQRLEDKRLQEQAAMRLQRRFRSFLVTKSASKAQSSELSEVTEQVADEAAGESISSATPESSSASHEASTVAADTGACAASASGVSPAMAPPLVASAVPEELMATLNAEDDTDEGSVADAAARSTAAPVERPSNCRST